MAKAMMNSMRLTVLGSRGSIPVVDSRMMKFGGNTSCYQVEAAGETLLLDAGTGIVRAVPGESPVRIVFSHCHLDHLLGLPLCPAMMHPECEVHLYASARSGMSPEEQIRRLLSPPLWPATPDKYPARVFFHELSLPERIGAFTVEGMETTHHPGGSLVLKISAGGKTIVYATDFNHTEGEEARLTAFCRGADLLLYDAQYTREEYEQKRDFGHSTAEAGLRIQRQSGAKQLLLIHHDPAQTDEMLEAREKNLGVRFAREGDVVEL